MEVDDGKLRCVGDPGPGRYDRYGLNKTAVDGQERSEVFQQEGSTGRKEPTASSRRSSHRAGEAGTCAF